jgi:hypothetical protein
MDDAVAMGLTERVGDLARVAQHFLDEERTSGKPLGERLPFEILHHQERQSVLMPDVVQRADVGMIQAGDGARFPLKALQRVGASRGSADENLNRDRPTEPRVTGSVDLAHATDANQLLDLVRAQSCAWFESLHNVGTRVDDWFQSIWPDILPFKSSLLNPSRGASQMSAVVVASCLVWFSGTSPSFLGNPSVPSLLRLDDLAPVGRFTRTLNASRSCVSDPVNPLVAITVNSFRSKK